MIMYKLSIVEKAKRYDEAIKKLRSLHNDYDTVSTLIDVKEELENIFPELAENEDERVKKAIFGMVYDSDNELWSSYDVSKSDVLAWLEKKCEQKEDTPPFNDTKYLVGFDTGREVQKIFDEQKPTEWSKDDKENLYHVDALIKDSSLEVRRQEYLSNWLKDRVLPQPNQEWSEEDERNSYNLLYFLNSNRITADDREDSIQWLKSLKDRVQPKQEWKPSEEQMENLSRACNGGTYRTSLLMDLYQDLKKLIK